MRSPEHLGHSCRGLRGLPGNEGNNGSHLSQGCHPDNRLLACHTLGTACAHCLLLLLLGEGSWHSLPLHPLGRVVF